MKYVKIFNQHTDYNTYITGNNKILPNVSYCDNEEDVHYNPWIDPILIVKYNVVDDSNPTMLYFYMSDGGSAAMFDKVELDGTEISITSLDSSSGYYQLSEGEHTARYILKNPALIGVEIIDESTEQINIGATFLECTAISEVKIPNTVTVIGRAAFGSCTSLTSITIPNSVTYIGFGAFGGCSNLTSISIPNSVTTINSRSFYYCQNLESITFEDVTKITINDEIGDYIFADCPKLESINITADTPWTFMPYRGFMRCYALKSIVIPNTVTNIMGMALCDCTSLTTITIPAGVTTIGMQAFDGCTSLTSITCLPTTPPTLNNTNQFNATNNCPIYVPAESVAAYKAASGWSTYASRIQAIPSA